MAGKKRPSSTGLKKRNQSELEQLTIPKLVGIAENYKFNVELRQYMDEDGKSTARLPKYGGAGDFDLSTGKGERLITLHFFSRKIVMKSLVF
jgi:hypothetical protein